MNDFDAKRFIVRTVIVAPIAFIVLLFFVPVPPDNKEVLIAQVAAVSTAFGLVVGYYFGSSSGSARKTDMLNKTEPPKETKP